VFSVFFSIIFQANLLDGEVFKAKTKDRWTWGREGGEGAAPTERK